MQGETLKKHFFIRQVDSWLPASILENRELARKGRLLISACFGVSAVSLGYGTFFSMVEYFTGLGACIYGGLSAVILLFIFKRKGNFVFAGNFFAFTCFMVFLTFSLSSLGLSTLISAWILIVPLTASLLANKTSGLIWTFLSILLVFGLYFLGEAQLLFFNKIPVQNIPLINLVALNGLILFVGIMSWVYERGKGVVRRKLALAKGEIEKRNREIEMAQIELEKKNREVLRINLDLEKEVNKRTVRLEKSNLELDTFLYESSHALRRPLARILGLVQILKGEVEPDQIKLYCETMDITAKRMDILLHSLVRVSELSNYKLKINEIVVKDLVKTVWERLETSAKQGGFVLETHFEDELSFRGDLSLLVLVLENLVDNSIKYSKSSTARGKVVRISGKKLGEWVEIKIWDNGLGIHAVMLPKLFEMFSRGTEKSIGSGLGLYMVGKIVERIEGVITVKSELGEFTEFTLKIPAISNVEGVGIWRAGSR